jgi:DNA replication protein DnaC
VRAEGQIAQATACLCIPDCARCNDTGRVEVAVDGGLRVGRCRCRMVHDRVLLFNAARIPGRYAAADLASFSAGAQRIHKEWQAGTGRYDRMPQMESFMAVMQWMSAFDPGRESRGLVLHGAVGRGKTHLLVATLRSLALERGARVRFIEFSRLLGILREGFSQNRSGANVMAELVDVPVLGIDELGKGRLTDWELSVIDELISRRYNAMKTTLGTTNYAPEAPTGALHTNLAAPEGAPKQTLGDRIGERAWSRLAEMADFVEVGGEDYRAFKKRTGDA